MKNGLVILIALFVAFPAWTATNNSGNPPTFLWIDLCTNGIGDSDGAIPYPRMEPNVFDIGVDLGADGTIDRWLSQEGSEFLGRDNASTVAPLNWRRFYIRLDFDAGKMAKIRIVDNSTEYYMAINAIRLNYADGKVVPNLVPNGWFEDDPPLNGWTIVSGSLRDPAALIQTDTSGQFSLYSTKFLSTTTTPATGASAETVVIESNAFPLTPPSSFIYGMVSGGGSELWNKSGAGGSDNASGVFIDVGTATQNPNGVYDEGTDIPLTGFIGGTSSSIRNQIHPVFFNTSGLEGRRAQVVAIDNSRIFHVGMDSFRMNWNLDVIKNGGFDDGIPTPAEDPNAIAWFSEEALEWNEHPSGAIPGWTVTSTDIGSVYFFDKACHGSMFSGRTYVGTAGYTEADRIFTGVKLTSDVFVIESIPNPAESVFLQFAAAQGSARERYTSNGSSRERGYVALNVDVNGDGTFEGPGDYVYAQTHQGMGQNLNTSNMDLWSYPEFRFYIKPEHQGKMAQIYVEDTMGPSRGSYGWMCVDDFFVWDGKEARLAFPNSDFEMGSLENWTEEVGINGGALRSWLAGSADSFYSGLVEHVSMNNRHSVVDGAFSADTAANEYTGGDAGTGTLISIPFELPTVSPTHVADWSVF
ncbi:MAG: hypothetical protein C4527_09480 [Candidatus Omnitrophota bacterium]|jgi:hypothetical protein|nr:MAG: hypothetical protein C4527_09480 [Candidatus Omnitrophota bacterium]